MNKKYDNSTETLPNGHIDLPEIDSALMSHLGGLKKNHRC
jgi:hypothetical protein